MNGWDILLLALIAAAVVLALCSVRRRKRSCCGDCTRCAAADRNRHGKDCGRTQ